MRSTAYTATPYAQDVRHNACLLCSLILTLDIDTQTAIFAETTTNLTPFDVLQRRHPFGGPGKPEDIAKIAVTLASDDASWLTGTNIPVDGGYTAR